ncbi:MAG: hypothetical protein R3C58_09275 [Parvularculaceae bacterium]
MRRRDVLKTAALSSLAPLLSPAAALTLPEQSGLFIYDPQLDHARALGEALQRAGRAAHAIDVKSLSAPSRIDWRGVTVIRGATTRQTFFAFEQARRLDWRMRVEDASIDREQGGLALWSIMISHPARGLAA